MSPGGRVGIVLGSIYCGGSSTNLLGMDFRGCWPLPVTFASIAIGIGVGWLVLLAISKLRSRGA